MNGLKGLLIGFCVTGMITILFFNTTLFFSDKKNQDSNREVFSSSKMIQLTSDNLVDLIIKHTDTSHIKSIQFNSHTLEIDLLVEDKESEQFVYDELPQFVYFAFMETKNVEQLNIRVFDIQGVQNHKVMILSAKMYRNDAWLETGITSIEDENWLDDRKWQQRLRINKTIYWQNQYEI